MTRPKPGDIIWVRWRDARALEDNVWITHKDALRRTGRGAIIESAGRLLKRTKHMLVIARDLALESGMVGAALELPCAGIIKLRILRRAP